MDRVRVCFAAYFFDPNKGGGALMYYRYLPGFQQRGIDTAVFSGTPKAAKVWEDDRNADWRRLASGAPLPVATMNGARMHGVRLPDSGGRKRTRLYFDALIQHCQNPETRPRVVNLLTKPSGEAAAWARRLRGLGIPLVYSHTIAPPIPEGRLARCWKLRMFRRYFEPMDCVVIQSAYHKSWLREIGYRGRIEVIPNGVDTNHSRPATDPGERARLREKLGFSATDRVVVTVGAVTPRKGTDLMIESIRDLAARVPTVRLEIIGWRTDQTDPRLAEFRKKIEDLTSAPEIASRVHFPGVVDNLNEWLRASDAYLFASHREGFPSGILEAMASGLPSVSTRFIGWGAELGEPGRDYLLADHDPRSLADALAEILENPETAARLSSAGLQWVRSAMKIETTYDRFADLYRDLAR